jgi:hypothetical protein
MDSKPDTIKLDGRSFQGPAQDLTATQDLYIMSRLRLADAFPIIRRITPENFERCEQDLLTAIMMRHDGGFELLAGLLTEIGKPWDRREAGRNALAFAAITDAGEKYAMQTQVVHFVMGFMEPARPSSQSSPSSSNASGAGLPIASAEPATSATLQ